MKQLMISCVVSLLWLSLASAGNDTNQPLTRADTVKASEDFHQPNTLSELLALPPDQLEKVDIARIDLLCAEGLPSSENLG